jgi:kinesin family protein 2/24
LISGSGKTFTMQPLPIRAAEDLVRLLHQPFYRNQRFKLWLSYFEIYGGKLFDLLSDRKLVFLVVFGFSFVCYYYFFFFGFGLRTLLYLI